jgi:hypothetical protein
MSYLLTILVSLLLLFVFLLWTSLETARGFRVLSGPRRKLDRQVAKVTFIVQHVDWGAFTAHMAKTMAERIAHDIVHAVLIAVRATERVLTKTIRTLRERVSAHNPSAEPVEGSQLINTIVRFRKSLRRDK